ncbi:MAG: acetoacetate decarboxylase family protein [Tepidiformaceae bacterium]
MPLTRFVKSPEEAVRYQQAFTAPAFLSMRTLAMNFETDPAIIAELLPHPLLPATDPRILVSVFDVGESNCVGPFKGASVAIACTFNGEDGFYGLTMPMSTDASVIFGRELYAEPKKLADIAFDAAAGHIHGTVTRHGVTYIDLRGTFEDEPVDVGREAVSNHYYFKYLPAADGHGLAFDPQLVCVTHRGVTRRYAPGTGTITFRESRHDPVIDLPVLSVGGATYTEGETRTSARVVATVPAATFLPYAFAQMDDLTAWSANRSDSSL